MSDMPKSIMIIGAAKCGTTTLYNHLVQHPDICEGIIKEPEYFTINRGDEKYKNRSYISLFNIDLSKHKYTLDASTGYSMCHNEKGVAQRMKDYGLNPFIIYIVRNPLDRIRSHYNFSKGNLNGDHKIDSLHFLSTSSYFKQLEQYRKVFGKSRMLIVEFDDLKKNPGLLCRKIFKFLGSAAFDIQIKTQVYNQTQPTNRKRLQVVQKLQTYSIKRFIPTEIKEWGKSILTKALPDKNEDLSKIQEASMKKNLYADMVSLQREYSIDIGKWGFQHDS